MKELYFKIIRRGLPKIGQRWLGDIGARLYLDFTCFRHNRQLKDLNIVIGVPRSGTTLIAKLLSDFGLSISEPFRQIFFFGNPIGSAEHSHRFFPEHSRNAPLGKR